MIDLTMATTSEAMSVMVALGDLIAGIFEEGEDEN